MAGVAYTMPASWWMAVMVPVLCATADAGGQSGRNAVVERLSLQDLDHGGVGRRIHGLYRGRGDRTA